MRRSRLTLAYVSAFLVAAAVLAGCQGEREWEGDPTVTASRRGHFRPGLWDVSAGGSASLHRIENQDIDRANTVEASPQIGYFVTDRLEVLASVGIDYQDVRYKDTDAPLALKRVKQTDYAGALGLQYNLDDGGAAVPFVRVFGGAVESRREMTQTNIPLVGTATQDLDTTAPYAGFRVGIRYFVTDRISSDMGVGMKRIWYEEDFGDTTDDVSMTFGVSFLF